MMYELRRSFAAGKEWEWCAASGNIRALLNVAISCTDGATYRIKEPHEEGQTLLTISRSMITIWPRGKELGLQLSDLFEVKLSNKEVVSNGSQ